MGQICDGDVQHESSYFGLLEYGVFKFYGENMFRPSKNPQEYNHTHQGALVKMPNKYYFD